jgi:hypothetical protein
MSKHLQREKCSTLYILFQWQTLRLKIILFKALELYIYIINTVIYN